MARVTGAETPPPPPSEGAATPSQHLKHLMPSPFLRRSRTIPTANILDDHHLSFACDEVSGVIDIELRALAFLCATAQQRPPHSNPRLEESMGSKTIIITLVVLHPSLPSQAMNPIRLPPFCAETGLDIELRLSSWFVPGPPQCVFRQRISWAYDGGSRPDKNPKSWLRNNQSSEPEGSDLAQSREGTGSDGSCRVDGEVRLLLPFRFILEEVGAIVARGRQERGSGNRTEKQRQGVPRKIARSCSRAGDGR
ncbi:hypothetical protein BDK51DRAFT_47088 [Blyttiomyces helicus]|uniref:Uncharacterized protein n=1 Tax=Blyttiomyces helicus TaxID=388810 RepID=A0A4P9WHD8_9FUNG|nr:hypothetical protein BDK51DRAFT_47088 [Blyttiomyces helicus]|eukprot:RKO89946.1 hypothetical protein BDK51DRAFT_47088 [Blyttiomyces helicus]